MSRRLLLLCAGLAAWAAGLGSEPCESGPRRVAPYPVWASPAEARVTVLRSPAANPGYPAPVLDYRFQDGAGTTVTDSAPGARHGTIYGAYTWGDHQLTINTIAYVSVPATTSVLGLADAGTIAVRGSAPAGTGAGLAGQSLGATQDWSVGYCTSDGRRNGYLRRSGALVAWNITAPGTCSTSTMTYVIRWSAGTANGRVGATETSMGFVGPLVTTSGAAMRIGYGGTSNFTSGTRVVRRYTVWTQDLTAAEIAAWEAEQ